MPSPSAVIIARSAGDRWGCHTSKMNTTRSSSLSFQASCSIVSSKTHAVPGTHSRVSLPTMAAELPNVFSMAEEEDFPVQLPRPGVRGPAD